MNLSAVVETVDVIKNTLPCLCAALITVVEDKLSFQDAEETFSRSIVPAVTRAAHTANHAVLCQ